MKLTKLLFLWILYPFFMFSQESTLYINGDFYIGKELEKTTLYIKGDMIVEGDNVLISQNGITSLTGNFVNNVNLGNIFDNNSMGLFEFTGFSPQNVGGNADKSLHYINFPNIRVNNKESVKINSSMSIKVNNLYLDKGRLILQSNSTDVYKRTTESAYLFIREGGSVFYNREAEVASEKGVIEIELTLDDNFKNKRLIGFSPPFKKIYSDYFIFNFLSKPSPAGLFGDSNRLITDISTSMNAGEGYIVGQGIIEDENYYHEHLDPFYSEALYEDRYTTKFSFARDFIPHSFGQYNTEPDRFIGEEINISDVNVPLMERGFNYVGNPFTTPIDLSSFVQTNSEADEWGVTRSLDGSGEVRSSFYVMSGGTGSYNEQSGKFTFTVSYLLGQEIGSTLNVEDTPSFLIAPMQMFIIGKNKDGLSNFIIPASKRTNAAVPFLKKSASYLNEILIEAQDGDTQAYDRACLVFRENSSLESNDPYDAVKIFNYSGGVSQIYTVSSDGKKMTTNVISPKTKYIELFLQPAKEEKQVTLNGYRLNTLQSISEVWLEDKHLKKKTDFLQNPTYTFISSPQDKPDRFVLHFIEPIVNIDPLENQSEIIVFSYQNQIYVKGLNENDKGMIITISDLQGKILHKDKIQNIPQFSINKNLAPGLYIVNILGQRNNIYKVIIK